ncbi:TetR family transcriptional regulator [Microtetraspora sp. NBRC 13810]|uniref:TetR/AcrR family transcriptional regulator n=1 Tax=Microtetraspora sp. NBRC 13810 TaxID=3030990 RepID=UPI0024A3B047|nr:TetR/AcrR family transcriptional regulator [Microtetraspora sp. NBRC 13810]GLW06453.1 TetR family transcriptional regulator [Microtetraspora sp. NBRC 13810]
MPPDTRKALLQAATRLLDEGGVDAVTLREVGRLAGVSHNAPYKHFTRKEALLAALAAEELTRRNAALTEVIERSPGPEAALRTAMRDYIAWALDHPARFKLVFGTWTIHSPELATAADDAQATLVGLVAAAQRAGALPGGDPVRLASLLRALAHGAADLGSAGHLSSGGKGNADPGELVDDLIDYLRVATRDARSPA